MKAPQQVADIVNDALGERPLSVEHVPTLEASTVFRLELPSGGVYFKTEHEGHPVAVLAWAYRKGAAAGVPVPEVLHVDLSCERWPEEFIVISAVPGSDLQSDPLEGAELADVLGRAGELLRRLHGIAVDGFGELDFPDPPASVPVGPFGDHASAVSASVDWALPYVIEHRLVPDKVVGRVREVLARNDELLPPLDQGVLLHDDLGLDHLFVERDGLRITGLIDFQPRSGDPMWDIGMFAYHYPDLSGHLIEGYGETPDDLDLRFEVYGLVRAVGEVRWEHERGFDIGRALAEIDRRSSHLGRLLD